MHVTSFVDAHASFMQNIPFLACTLLVVTETHINGLAMTMETHSG